MRATPRLASARITASGARRCEEDCEEDWGEADGGEDVGGADWGEEDWEEPDWCEETWWGAGAWRWGSWCSEADSGEEEGGAADEGEEGKGGEMPPGGSAEDAPETNGTDGPETDGTDGTSPAVLAPSGATASAATSACGVSGALFTEDTTLSAEDAAPARGARRGATGTAAAELGSVTRAAEALEEQTLEEEPAAPDSFSAGVACGGRAGAAERPRAGLASGGGRLFFAMALCCGAAVGASVRLGAEAERDAERRGSEAAAVAPPRREDGAICGSDGARGAPATAADATAAG